MNTKAKTPTQNDRKTLSKPAASKKNITAPTINDKVRTKESEQDTNLASQNSDSDPHATSNAASTPGPPHQYADNERPALPPYLSVKQLAALLHVNEKKIYQLAAEGDIPSTKITGKWIFPSRMIEDWITENSHGGVMADRLLISGADDLLLERSCREQARAYRDSAFLAYSPSGTMHGLKMLEAGKTDACFIHWGATDPNALRHLGLLRSFRFHQNWVAVRCLQRQQGFVITPRLRAEFSFDLNNNVTEQQPNKSNHEQNPDKKLSESRAQLESILRDPRMRWATRGPDSGTGRMLQDLYAEFHIDSAAKISTTHCHNERHAIALVAEGLSDITLASQTAARESNLHFIPVCWVSIDLVMTRKTYFRKMTQELLKYFLKIPYQHGSKNIEGYNLPEHHELLTVK